VNSIEFLGILSEEIQEIFPINHKFAGKINQQMIRNLESHDIFKLLFDSAGEGLVLVDQSGTLLMVNTRIEEMFGYPRNELLGQKVEILIPEDLRHKHVHHREGYNVHPKKRSMGVGMDLVGSRKDKTTLPIEISLNYFYSSEEMVIMALITDITERKKIAEELLRLNQDLEQRVDDRTQMLAGAIKELEYSNKNLEKAEEELKLALETERELGELKSRFVSTASHEFRTPLATILSSVSLIAKYTKPEDQEKRVKHIDRIKSTVNDMREILNDFLSLSKLEEGKMRNSPVTFEIVSFCKSIADEMQMLAKPGQQINYAHEGSETVHLDNQLLKNVFVNLLTNAIKFSEEGKQIRFRSILKKESLLISVQDNGIGMSHEDQKHLFERFFRGQNAASIQGTGLGLNIVRKYVELMGGEISFESKLNEGTTFSVSFDL
jgi:PAS domain S-box-containing protein